MTTVRNGKRILSVTIKQMVDDSPDTSYYGEYANRPSSEYSIDRKHAEDCPINTGLASELIPEEDRAECDCGEHGDMERNQYRYFNPSFNYVDKNGHALPENTPEEARNHVRQNYERMEDLNRGGWCYIGIRAEAEIGIEGKEPARRYHFEGRTTQTITSGGLWGVESDSDREYLESIEKDELLDLKAQLRALGFSTRSISKAFENIERKDS